MNSNSGYGQTRQACTKTHACSCACPHSYCKAVPRLRRSVAGLSSRRPRSDLRSGLEGSWCTKWHCQIICLLSASLFQRSITLAMDVLKKKVYIYISRAGIAQSVQRLATGWTVRGSSPGGAKFSTLVQTGPGAHLTSCTTGTGSLSWE